MSYGKHNHFVITLTASKTDGADYDFVGDTSKNLVAGPNGVLPFKARLVKVKGVVASMGASDKDALVQVHAGAAETDTAVLNSSGLTFVDNTTKKVSGTILDDKKIYNENQQFCLSETSTADSNVKGLAVHLVFRSMEP